MDLDQIILGDCREALSDLPDNSIDAVITDPPYGLGSKLPSLEDLINYLSGGELDTGGDFMGNAWDIPSVSVWEECLRVLKPGGHLFSFGGTRTYDLISLGLRAAGFELRDTIASEFGVQCLQWVYGQGFPKSFNLYKNLVKAGIDREVAKHWIGWGTALKPSWEPIFVCRKPLDGLIVGNVLTHGVGGLNIGGCRVGTESIIINAFDDGMKPFGNGAGCSYKTSEVKGRWPTNLILQHDPRCGAICVDGCPAGELDRQSGNLKSGVALKKGIVSGKGYRPNALGHESRPVGTRMPSYGDCGGASRYFTQIDFKSPFIYTKKVGSKERFRQGRPDQPLMVLRSDLTDEEMDRVYQEWPESDGTSPDLGLALNFIPEPLVKYFRVVDQYTHPTPKPLRLMEHLVQLGVPTGGVVLDPYGGSGTTAVAAKIAGDHYIVIERDHRAHGLSCRRVAAMTQHFDSSDLKRDQQSAFELIYELE